MVKTLPDLEWLWPGWLPSGLVSLLAATPGTGKSYLALDLAHRVISGTEFPNGSPVLTPGPVVYVDAENTPSVFKKRVQTWSPRALAQFYIMLPDLRRLVINLDEAEDRERLWDMC
jgi:RecA-family ATPase